MKSPLSKIHKIHSVMLSIKKTSLSALSNIFLCPHGHEKHYNPHFTAVCVLKWSNDLI